MIEDPQTEKDEIGAPVRIEPETVEEPEYVGKVIYEQDIRAATHSNGWASDLVGGSVDGDGNFPPDDNNDHHGRGDKQPKTLRYMLAGTYLAAGMIALYVGATMIRDLRGEK